MKVKRAASLIIAVVLALLCLSIAFAYSVPDDTIVYVTPYGKKYHLENCSYLNGSYKTMSIEVADRRGYDPCSRCNPDINTGSYYGSGSSGSTTTTDSSKSYWEERMEALERGEIVQTNRPEKTSNTSKTSNFFESLAEKALILFVSVASMLLVNFVFYSLAKFPKWIANIFDKKKRN